MPQLAHSAMPSLKSLGLGKDGGLSTSYAAMPEDEARQVAEARWNIIGNAIRLPSEKDDTFRIATSSGESFILKVSNPAESAQELDLELSAMRHVEMVDPGLPIPRVVPSRTGASLVDLYVRAGSLRKARLLTYIEGTILDSTEASSREREKVGEILAKLRLALAGFSHPAEMRPYLWDVKNLPALAPLLEDVSEAGQHALLSRGLERFSEVVVPGLACLRRQVVHNDFSRSNIVVDHDQPSFVVGVIDFGDVVNTAVAIDVSTALLNQLPRKIPALATDDIFLNGRDILRGYVRFAELTCHELSIIPHLVMGRLIARALISLHRAKSVPDNAIYILRNTDQGWEQLRWFLDRSADEVSNLFSREKRDANGDRR